MLQLRRDSKLSLHEKLASEAASTGAQHSTILGIIRSQAQIAKIRYIDVVVLLGPAKASQYKCAAGGKYQFTTFPYGPSRVLCSRRRPSSLMVATRRSLAGHVAFAVACLP